MQLIKLYQVSRLSVANGVLTYEANERSEKKSMKIGYCLIGTRTHKKCARCLIDFSFNLFFHVANGLRLL